MSWIWQNVCKKGKTEEKYVWMFVYLPTRFDFYLFLMQKCFMKIILVLEIIMIDKFWFN